MGRIKNLFRELIYLYPLRTESAKAREVVPEEPVINDNHPSYTVLAMEKREPCDNRKGFGWSGRVFEIWATDVNGDPVEDQEVRFIPATAKGIVFDHPNLRGVTNEDGYVKYDHPQKVTYWTLLVDGVWLVDKLWVNREPTYCNPAPWPPPRRGPYNWRPVELPGDGSYTIVIRRKW